MYCVEKSIVAELHAELELLNKQSHAEPQPCKVGRPALSLVIFHPYLCRRYLFTAGRAAHTPICIAAPEKYLQLSVKSLA